MSSPDTTKVPNVSAAASPAVSPAVAATPVAATPVAATPVAATPVAATPVAATPVAATPVAATPVAATPVAATPAVNVKNGVAGANGKPNGKPANTGSGHIATLLKTGEKLSLGGDLTIIKEGGINYGVLPLSEETVSELRKKYGSSSANGASSRPNGASTSSSNGASTSSPNGASPAKGGSRKKNAKKSRKTRSKK